MASVRGYSHVGHVISYGFVNDMLALVVPHFEVNKVLPPISITKEELRAAKTLLDLDSRYYESWVREYLAVEIHTSHDGTKRKAISKNDTLNLEQKNNMNTHDSGVDINVIVNYIPENNLKDNPPQQLDFNISVDFFNLLHPHARGSGPQPLV